MTAHDLPFDQAVSAFKRALILEALALHRGNRSRAAAALKIERTSLLRLIRELNISGLPTRRRGRPPSPGSSNQPGPRSGEENRHA